ncbi:hypothetical protein chiPu_0023368 [Chiloscyllium punctatum]|uniref:DNA-directed RNA polymerase subunit n=1 Tax=Chiloscyllium punctatum TaxID=137246 RepID=A0A401T9A7_CHIPU|nr:hypothetical protein [Chiloscyllium punctatum]
MARNCWKYLVGRSKVRLESGWIKLLDRVVYNVGLCICLYDITKLEDSYIFPGDGASHTKVHFRYVVFRPFLDEIITGKIKGCSQDGVHGE